MTSKTCPILTIALLLGAGACGSHQSVKDDAESFADESDSTAFDSSDEAEPLGGADREDGVDPGDVWQPEPGTTWQWQLTGAVDHRFDVAMYDIDLFNVTVDEIAALQDEGRVVICYFSAGSWEDFRPDKDDFEQTDIGETLEGWPDERWLDIRSEGVRQIMARRLDLALSKGCDGVEPDNVDGYLNHTGFDLTEQDLLDYNRFIVAQAHARQLSVGLKNGIELVRELEPSYDWALNESCLQYDECALLEPFIDAGKAVFHVEYVEDQRQGPNLATSVCGDPTISGFSSMIKTWDLDAWQLPCWD